MTVDFDLERFVKAQAGVYARAIEELRAGEKRSHWMWFIFPQVEGLGFSAMARRYAIGSREEADAYFSHAVLGPRLVECTSVVRAVRDVTISKILGSPDDVKFRSCMTLFEAVSGDPHFGAALDQFYAGRRDQATLDIVARWSGTARGGRR